MKCWIAIHEDEMAAWEMEAIEGGPCGGRVALAAGYKVDIITVRSQAELRKEVNASRAGRYAFGLASIGKHHVLHWLASDGTPAHIDVSWRGVMEREETK